MKKVIGFALTGSFCTLDKAFAVMKELQPHYEILPILSERVAGTDTRFHSKEEVRRHVLEICKREPIDSIVGAEPLGPKKMLDFLVVCPCTGNTLSKLACGITDTAVTMAVKSHRRTGRGVLIALSTNDALSGSAHSIGTLMDKKGYYFVPFRQDDSAEKPASLQSDFSLVSAALRLAMEGDQLQPLMLPPL